MSKDQVKSDKDKIYVILTLLILFSLDIALIAGVLWHGKANFHAVYSNLIK